MCLHYPRIVACTLLLVVVTQSPAQKSARSDIKRTLDQFCAAAISGNAVVASYWDRVETDRSLRQAARRMNIQPTEARGSKRFLETMEASLASWAVSCAHPPQIVVTQTPEGKTVKGPSWNWRSVRQLLRLRMDDAGARAVASVLIETGRGDLRFLFKLVKDRGTWKIHDCCRVDGGLWWSEFLAAHFIPGIHLVAEHKEELQQLVSGIYQVGRYLLEEMPEMHADIAEMIAQARQLSPPPVLVARLDLLEGVLNSRTNKVDEALTLLRRARKVSHDLVEVHRLLGRMEKEQSQLVSAAVSLYGHAQAWDGDFEPFDELVQSLVDVGQRAKAIKVLDGIVARGRAPDAVTDRLVTLLLEEKKTGRAGEIIRASLDGRADVREQVLKARRWLGGSGANEALLAVATGYLEKKPHSALGVALKATALRRLGKLAEARQMLAEAQPAKNDPDLLMVWRQRAFTHAACGETEQAGAAARLVSERGSRPDFDTFVEAWVAVARDQGKAAHASLRKALLADYHYGVALQMEPTFRKFRRLRAGKRLIAMARRTREYVLEAERLVSAGQWDELLTLATRRLARMKRDHQAHRYKGLALRGIGQGEAALAAFRRALAACPRDKRVFFAKEIVGQLLDLGRVDEALRDADAWVDSHPRDPSLLLLRARVHLVGERPSTAMVDLRAALEAAPDLAHEVLRAGEHAILRKHEACLKLAHEAAGT